MDIDALSPGVDFEAEIRKTLSQIDVMLVVIGQHWIDLRDEAGRRIDNQDDYVRREIATALENAIRVIPVLVGGARQPKADILPEEIRGLARRQALEVTDTRWEYDTGTLIESLRRRQARVTAPGASASANSTASLANGRKDNSTQATLLIPVFDHPWAGRRSPDTFPELIVRNSGAVDAYRVSVAPIDLGQGTVLTTGNSEIHIPAGTEKPITLGRQALDRSPLRALPPQSVDIVEAVQTASSIKSLADIGHGLKAPKTTSWPIVVSYSLADGHQFTAEWTLQNDIEACRVRIIRHVRERLSNEVQSIVVGWTRDNCSSIRVYNRSTKTVDGVDLILRDMSWLYDNEWVETDDVPRNAFPHKWPYGNKELKPTSHHDFGFINTLERNALTLAIRGRGNRQIRVTKRGRWRATVCAKWNGPEGARLEHEETLDFQGLQQNLWVASGSGS